MHTVTHKQPTRNALMKKFPWDQSYDSNNPSLISSRISCSLCAIGSAPLGMVLFGTAHQGLVSPCAQEFSSQLVTGTSTICSHAHSVMRSKRGSMPFPRISFMMCGTGTPTVCSWIRGTGVRKQGKRSVPRFPRRTTSLFLNMLYVSCSSHLSSVMKLGHADESFSSSARPLSRKHAKSVIPNCQPWQQTGKHCRFNPNVSGHLPSRKNSRSALSASICLPVRMQTLGHISTLL